MKKKILLLMGIFLLGISYAQIGINTRNPLGIFHMDGKGNTLGITNMDDDVAITSDGNTGVNIAIGGPPLKGASIALYSHTKGFLPTAVQLQSVLDNTTISSPIEGMIVYNTVSAGVYPNNTQPGYYYYDKTKWIHLKTNAYLKISETRILADNVTTAPTSTVDALDAPIMDFGKIEILEAGGYAFSFNLSITSTTGAKYSRGVFYINILRKGSSDSGFSKIDALEINPFLFPNGESASISTLIGLDLEIGDEIKFTTGYDINYPIIEYAKKATYLIYWKL